MRLWNRLGVVEKTWKKEFIPEVCGYVYWNIYLNGYVLFPLKCNYQKYENSNTRASTLINWGHNNCILHSVCIFKNRFVVFHFGHNNWLYMNKWIVGKMYHDGHDNQWLWLMVFYCLYQQLTAAKWLFHVPARRCVPIYNLTKCTVRNDR